jgi:hypothetical protein
MATVLEVLEILVKDGYKAAHVEENKVFLGSNSQHVELINGVIDFSGCGSRRTENDMRELLSPLTLREKLSNSANASLRQAGIDAKRGEFLGNQDDLVEAVKLGYCSESDAMNQDF